ATAAAPLTATAKKLAFVCPDGFYQHAEPEFCVRLARSVFGPPEADGEWMTAEVGTLASVSYTKQQTVKAALDELRPKAPPGATDDKAIDKARAAAGYSEATDGPLTIVHMKKPDADSADGFVAATIAIGASGDFTVRCEVDGSMTPETICTTLT